MSDGLRGAHDGQGNRQRAQTNGRRGGRRGQGNGAPTVPAAEFTSYYNLPVINKPVWASPDIPVYLFLGGLAGAASLLGAGAQATGRSALGRVSKAGAFSAGVLSLVGLVHDLGRPSRFLNMLQVFKVTSPMSVGSWILAGYVPLAGVAAASSLFGKAPRIGMEATAGSALLGPAVASYTAALTSDTAVPAWHDGYPGDAIRVRRLGCHGRGRSGPARRAGQPERTLTGDAGVRCRHRTGCLRTDGAPRRDDRRALLPRPWRRLRPRRQHPVGDRPRRGTAQQAQPSVQRGVRRGANGRVGRHPVGNLYAGMQSATDPKYTIVPQRKRLRAATVIAGPPAG
jgi:hypothetical protein